MATKSKTAVETKAVYFEAVGRRKTSVARVRLFKDKEPNVVVNDKPLSSYFHTPALQKISQEAFSAAGLAGAYSVSAHINGGGIHSQAEALRHGISRAILKIDAESRKSLKTLGFLKRDPRMKERRKFGLKKARK